MSEKLWNSYEARLAEASLDREGAKKDNPLQDPSFSPSEYRANEATKAAERSLPVLFEDNPDLREISGYPEFSRFVREPGAAAERFKWSMGDTIRRWQTDELLDFFKSRWSFLPPDACCRDFAAEFDPEGKFAEKAKEATTNVEKTTSKNVEATANVEKSTLLDSNRQAVLDRLSTGPYGDILSRVTKDSKTYAEVLKSPESTKEQLREVALDVLKEARKRAEITGNHADFAFLAGKFHAMGAITDSELRDCLKSVPGAREMPKDTPPFAGFEKRGESYVRAGKETDLLIADGKIVAVGKGGLSLALESSVAERVREKIRLEADIRSFRQGIAKADAGLKILESLPSPAHADAEEIGAVVKAVAEATGIPALKALATSDRKPAEKLAILAGLVSMAYSESSEPLPAGDPEHAVEAAKSRLEGRKRFLEESISEAERKFRAADARPDAVAEAESKVRDLEAGIRFGERVHLDALGGAAEISALLSHVGSHPSLNRGVSVPVRLSDAFDMETVSFPVAAALCRLLGRNPEDLFHVPDYSAMKRFDSGTNPPREITAAYLRTLLADPAYGPPVVTSGAFDRRAMEARLLGENPAGRT